MTNGEPLEFYLKLGRWKEGYIKEFCEREGLGWYEKDGSFTPAGKAERVINFISKVELDARKDERERVIEEVLGVVEDGIFKMPTRHNYNSAEIYEIETGNRIRTEISTALKGLSGNNE